jgi:hypothetical protein
MGDVAGPKAAVPEDAAPEEQKKTSWKRRVSSWALIALGVLLALISVLAIWVNRVALDTDTYVDTTSQVLADDDVQAVLSEALVEQLYANVDVAATLRAALPPETKPLAGPIAGGLRQVAVRATDQLLDTRAVEQIWERASRRSHEQLILLLDDKSKLIRNNGGAVYIDLRPVVVQIGDRVGIGERLGTALPADAGRITIIQADQLDTIQKLVRFLRFVANWFWVFALLCWAAAIWIAKGRRRETLRAIGISFFLVGILVLVVRRVGGNIIVNDLVKVDANKPAVRDTWSIITAELRDIATTILIIGLVGTLGAVLAGPGRRVTAVRRWLAPYLAERVPVYIGALAVFLILIIWQPTGAFGRWLSLLTMAVLAVIGIEALRRQTTREFPDAERQPIRPGEWFASRREQRGEDPDAPDPETARLDQLERLAQLKERGVLTEEEFTQQKTALLGGG